eukprot:6463469-Amphidinium_carterae.2
MCNIQVAAAMSAAEVNALEQSSERNERTGTSTHSLTLGIAVRSNLSLHHTMQACPTALKRGTHTASAQGKNRSRRKWVKNAVRNSCDL